MSALAHIFATKTFNFIVLIRIFVGSYGAIVILPMIVWFLYPEMFFPGRSIGYVGFLLVGILFVNLGLTVRLLEENYFRRALTAFGLIIATAISVNSIAASQVLWPVFRATHDRDVALAVEIMTAAQKVEGFEVGRTPIRTIGGAQYDDLAFGQFINPSTFHPGVDMNSIFQVLFDARYPAGSLPFSPRACPAFPELGSVFISDETLFVCLESSDGPEHFTTCVPFDLGAGPAAFCWAEGLYILAAGACQKISLESGNIHVVLNRGSRSEELVFHHQVEPSLVNGVCVRPLHHRAVNVEDILIRHRPVADAQVADVVMNTFDAVPLDRILGR